MKQKELIYLSYDLNCFGNTFESAMNYFNQIYHAQNGIQNFEETLKLLSEEEKNQFHNQCQDLYFAYKTTTDIEEKWNILVSMALILQPQLYDKYPLVQNETSKKNKN